MKLTIIAVGKPKPGPYRELIRSYEERLTRFCQFSAIELKEASGSLEEARRREAEAIHGRIERLKNRSCVVIALDGNGEQLTTEEFAELMNDLSSQGRECVFVLGSHAGLDESIRAIADRSISLGKLTLPHQLARLVLTEQLYRAFSIIAGHPYHRA
jgi:23S rRNA (pseudouridine1915-N3)-methyltransferase